MSLNAGIAKRNIPAWTVSPVSGAVTNVAASAVQMITVLKKTKNFRLISPIRLHPRAYTLSSAALGPISQTERATLLFQSVHRTAWRIHHRAIDRHPALPIISSLLPLYYFETCIPQSF